MNVFTPPTVTDQAGDRVRSGAEIHALYDGAPARTYQGTTGVRHPRYGEEIRLVDDAGNGFRGWAADYGLTVTRTA